MEVNTRPRWATNCRCRLSATSGIPAGRKILPDGSDNFKWTSECMQPMWQPCNNVQVDSEAGDDAIPSQEILGHAWHVQAVITERLHSRDLGENSVAGRLRSVVVMVAQCSWAPLGDRDEQRQLQQHCNSIGMLDFKGPEGPGTVLYVGPFQSLIGTYTNRTIYAWNIIYDCRSKLFKQIRYGFP